jgi:hypothetical protein
MIGLRPAQAKPAVFRCAYYVIWRTLLLQWHYGKAVSVTMSINKIDMVFRIWIIIIWGYSLW